MFSAHSFKLYSLRYRAKGNNCFGAQAFNKCTLDASKFDQRKDSPKIQRSKRQFLSKHPIIPLVFSLSVESAINPVVLLASCTA